VENDSEEYSEEIILDPPIVYEKIIKKLEKDIRTHIGVN
jgi:hypothetical protein